MNYGSMIPDYEVLSGSYFMTVSLKPDLYSFSARSQFKKTNDKLFKLIKGYSNNFMMTTELTKKANIHYHIIIKFKDMEYVSELLIEALRSTKEFGNTMINPDVIIETERTLNYIKKDIHKTYTIINNIKYGKSNYTQIFFCHKIHIVPIVAVPQPVPDTTQLDMLDLDDFLIEFNC